MKNTFRTLLIVTIAMVTWVSATANDICPISGNPVDKTITVAINGKAVGFCCNDCSQSYQKALNVVDKGPDKCPISGKPALKENRLLHAKTKVEYFCCENCPKGFAEKNAFALKDQGPGACPVSGKPSVTESSLVHNGETIYFCCNNCPKGYLQKIAAVDEGPQKCPISGKAALAEQKMVTTQTEAVYFCCGDCPKAYAEKNFAKRN